MIEEEARKEHGVRDMLLLLEAYQRTEGQDEEVQERLAGLIAERAVELPFLMCMRLAKCLEGLKGKKAKKARKQVRKRVLS